MGRGMKLIEGSFPMPKSCSTDKVTDGNPSQTGVHLQGTLGPQTSDRKRGKSIFIQEPIYILKRFVHLKTIWYLKRFHFHSITSSCVQFFEC